MASAISANSSTCKFHFAWSYCRKFVKPSRDGSCSCSVELGLLASRCSATTFASLTRPADIGAAERKRRGASCDLERQRVVSGNRVAEKLEASVGRPSHSLMSVILSSAILFKLDGFNCKVQTGQQRGVDAAVCQTSNWN